MLPALIAVLSPQPGHPTHTQTVTFPTHTHDSCRSGFLEIWLLLMPFGLFSDVQDPASNPQRHPVFELLLYLLICILMLGVDEVASQLEQPFPHMPLLDMAATTLRDIDRWVTYRGRPCISGAQDVART